MSKEIAHAIETQAACIWYVRVFKAVLELQPYITRATIEMSGCQRVRDITGFLTVHHRTVLPPVHAVYNGCAPP